MTKTQKLKKEIKDYPNDVVAFTNGAFITPVKLANGKWGWAISSFEDSTFFDGEEVEVNSLWNENISELVGEEEEEEEK